MIEELILSNVRLFEGPHEWRIPLNPLTVFCGTNSAGKSTIIKSLLLLCQNNSDADAVGRVGQVRLTGGLVDFGSYEALVSHNKIEQDVMFGLTIRSSIEIRHLQSLMKIRGVFDMPPSQDSELAYTLTAKFTCGLRLPTTTNPGPPAPAQRRKAGPQRVFLKRATFNFKAESDLTLEWKVVEDAESGLYNILLPLEFFRQWSPQLQYLDVLEQSDSKCASVEVLLRGLLPIGFWAQSVPREKAASETTNDFAFFPLPSLMTECVRDLELDLDHVHYLGPLRSPARRYYMTNLDADPKMDPAGEFLPYVLRDQRDREVFFVPPKGNSIERKLLTNALDSWMLYLRTGEISGPTSEQDVHEIDVASMKNVLLEFTVRSFGGESHALADSGFGYSQILPILVRGLIAQFGSTIIIEQPELHLNPAIQVRLAEFLTCLTIAGKRVLIETHSEHIVNSIRVLTAEDLTNNLTKKCKIVFVNTESGNPRLEQLEIQHNGTIPQWPRQFFGEALLLSSRLLKAQGEKKHHADPK